MMIDYLDMGCDPDDGEPYVSDAEMYERLAQDEPNELVHVSLYEDVCRERDALRAKLAAVPVDALRFCVDAADYTYDVMVSVADAWIMTLRVKP
jgi:hypothetical protein